MYPTDTQKHRYKMAQCACVYMCACVHHKTSSVNVEDRDVTFFLAHFVNTHVIFLNYENYYVVSRGESRRVNKVS